jgi:hypothetical protein
MVGINLARRRWLAASAMLAKFVYRKARAEPEASTYTPELVAGKLVDNFKLRTDPDDTLAFARAIAAGEPVVLGARTYSISSLNIDASTTHLTIFGAAPGQSAIQRIGNSSSAFIQIASAYVTLDGVTFDMNKARVTANQWGVLITSDCAQQITVRRCRFVNNSGTLGCGLGIIGKNPTTVGSIDISDNEISECVWGAMYLASIGNAVVRNNYIHDNAGAAIYCSSWQTASSTNYSSDVLFTNNRISRCRNGIQCGGIAPPYIYGTPSAVRCKMIANDLQDITSYGLVAQGDYIDTIANKIDQSAPNVPVFAAIGYTGRWGSITDNQINYSGSSYCIDVGGCQGIHISDNTIYATSGVAINIGGTTNCHAVNNFIWTQLNAILAYEVEADGTYVPFPYFCSGLVIDGNNITMDGGSSRGILTLDNPGGRRGAVPIRITGNHFQNVNGSSLQWCISCIGGGAALSLGGNTQGGLSYGFSNPNGNGDIIAYDVWDEVVTYAGAAKTIRSVLPPLINTYGCGTINSILWTFPTSGGSGYSSATTLRAHGTEGGSGWTGIPLISQGVIVGVRTTAHGSGYKGAVTITAIDSGGGHGATFEVGNVLYLPIRKLRVSSSGVISVLRASGGSVSLAGVTPIILTTSTPISLTAQSNQWVPDPVAPVASFAVESLLRPSPDNAGAIVYVTDSTTGKWMARSNGKSWVWPDGTKVIGAPTGSGPVLDRRRQTTRKPEVP